MKKYWCLLCLLPALAELSAQKFPQHPEEADASNKGSAILFHLGFGVHWPGGDLAERFGAGGNVGGAFEWISAKSNWIIGTSGHFQYGNVVKEDPLEMLRTAEGDIIASDRSIPYVITPQRACH